MINWREYIISDEATLLGKPIIKGTRLSVEFILERLADGWTKKMILENYPSLSEEGLTAVFSYAYDCMKDGLMFNQELKRA